jgi:hypothetical protein
LVGALKILLKIVLMPLKIKEKFISGLKKIIPKLISI